MDKTYKISYKTYLNDRLKQVEFHGKWTHPLYIQATFDRKTIFFKSYYFELFSKPRYEKFLTGEFRGPSLEEVIEKENEFLEFLIDKNLPDFSLDLFKQDYAFYSKDLCDLTVTGFIDYLFYFFYSEGMLALAYAIKEGSKSRIPYEVVQDMKSAFNKPLYDKLVERSFHFPPPYLPLYGFMEQTKKWPMLSLTVMEWEDPTTKNSFAEYMVKYYPGKNAAEVIEQVNNWLIHLRKEPDLRP